jgi:hypothetical protein
VCLKRKRYSTDYGWKRGRKKKGQKFKNWIKRESKKRVKTKELDRHVIERV